MAKYDPSVPKVIPTSRYIGGIADYDKEGAQSTYSFGRSIDYRTNPREVTLLPKTTKESGTVITDLPKWGERVSDTTYIYGNNGNIYSRNSSGSYSLLRNVASSHGNGMKYYGEDGYLYYTSDKVIGRYGPISGTPTFIDDYFGSQGGVPTNTYSLSLASASSQYASVADSASLSIIGDIALEVYFNPTTLPTVGNSMTLIGKWDESGTTKSYKFDIYAVSGYFGDGSDGALTISADTTDSPIDSACTGTSGATSLSATNASFATGQIILIHQTQGTGAGTWQRNKIQGYTAGTITLDTALNATYGTGAQVIVMKQYSSVTINSGKTWTAKAWTGTVGGILAFLCSGTVTVTGTITATGKGFRGGAVGNNTTQGYSGEGTAGASVQQRTANGNGGGAGILGSGRVGGGAGGGHSSSGTNGVETGTGNDYGFGGNSVGTTDLTTMDFGGAGGAGGQTDENMVSGTGGNGGGIVFITGTTLTISGSITSNGNNGQAAQSGIDSAGGGGGAGGAILFKAQTATFGSSLISASAGSGGSGSTNGGAGGAGSTGRIHLDYYTSYTGTTSPTLDVIQDNTLVTTTTYQFRIGISNDGTASEYLTKNVSISTGNFYRGAVSWVASTSTATFYLDGVSQGTSIGTKTAIHDNASAFSVGANKVSAYQNFFNGLIDDVRVWNTTRTADQFLNNKDIELGGSEAGLAAYYKLNNAYTDSTANANNLTGTGSPTFSTTVPFSNPTTRLDIDQSAETSGNTYTLATAISETSTDRHTFVPAKDPQKSIDVKLAAKGTGDWTLTVHDAFNRSIASATITNANLRSAAGLQEFTFTTPWRPIIGATYHFHVTSTVADGTVTTTTASDFSTVHYHTYFQFLVTDTDYHPIERMLNLIAIGNERYVATYDASTYTPNKLKLPAGWKVRCFALWREYLAIGCWKGTNIYDYDEGLIVFWDGFSTTYNFYISVPEGGINAMIGSRGVLHVWAGYQGDHLVYIGGDKANKIKRIPKMTKDNYIEIMPGAVGMWQALLRYGVAGNTDSTAVERGIYTYGGANQNYPDSLSYDYPISTGNRGSTVKIGLVLALDRKLLIGWQDNVSYGVDVVDPSGNPFADGTVENLITDNGGVYKQKQTMIVRADFKSLNSGEKVRVKYKLDRASDWTYGDWVTTAAETKARLPIKNGIHREVQIAADLATTTTTAPTLLELTMVEDLLGSEELV